MPKKNTCRIGKISELKFKIKVLEFGIDTLTPDTETLPYDFAMEINERFYKVQVKTGRLKNGTILFNTCGKMCNMTKIVTKTYQGKIDYFGVYCKYNDGYYLVPIANATKSEMRLRIDPAKNNNKRLVNWAKDYLLENQLQKILDKDE